MFDLLVHGFFLFFLFVCIYGVQVETQEDDKPKEAERTEIRLHDKERG